MIKTSYESEYSQIISETSQISMMLRAIIRKLDLNSKLQA